MDDIYPISKWPRFVAYVYPGWHANAFRPGIDEWTLLDQFRPYFEGHMAPPRPANGPYDDSTRATAQAHIRMAVETGIEAFLYFMYYDGNGFVMSKPMEAALEEADEGFGIAGSWCVRLPHDQFPVPALDELELPSELSNTLTGKLEDTPLELLTLHDLQFLLEDDDPLWTMADLIGG